MRAPVPCSIVNSNHWVGAESSGNCLSRPSLMYNSFFRNFVSEVLIEDRSCPPYIVERRIKTWAALGCRSFRKSSTVCPFVGWSSFSRCKIRNLYHSKIDFNIFSYFTAQVENLRSSNSDMTQNKVIIMFVALPWLGLELRIRLCISWWCQIRSNTETNSYTSQRLSSLEKHFVTRYSFHNLIDNFGAFSVPSSQRQGSASILNKVQRFHWTSSSRS